MAVKVLSLCLLLGLVCLSWTKCPKYASTCRDCIQAGPGCAWCRAPDTKIRCGARKVLEKAGCDKRHIYHPKGGVQIVRNDSRTESADARAVFLQPQAFNVSLRPGVGQSFPLTITLPKDHPVTELTLDTSPVPAGVNITFNSTSNGNPLVIQVYMEAARCPRDNQNSTGPWSVQITPRGFLQSLELQLTLECQCGCINDRVANSPSCHGHGDVVCGKCECKEPYIGLNCDTRFGSFDSPNEDMCRSGQNEPVCSGRGDCVEGSCECHMRENPEERYAGRYCECSNFDCPRSNDMICGGHGECMCGRCVCQYNYTGDACSCSLNNASCMASNKQLCNGRGDCRCGTCICHTGQFLGPTCEICPTCEGVCAQTKPCVECRAFGTGIKKDNCDKECGHVTLAMVNTKDDVPSDNAYSCKLRDGDDCWFYYSVPIAFSGGLIPATVAQAKECPRWSW